MDEEYEEVKRYVPHNNRLRNKLKDYLDVLLKRRYEVRGGIMADKPFGVWDNLKEEIYKNYSTRQEAEKVADKLNEIKE